MSEAMECPKDLIEWANSDHSILWYLYDVDLLPEQVHTKEQVCALRGFQFGWKCHALSRSDVLPCGHPKTALIRIHHGEPHCEICGEPTR